MKYGIPYQGSKQTLADRIVALMPAAGHFYDLFAGGCAMTHCAMLSGKYRHIHTNDLTDSPQVFADALAGKYVGEDRWISREEFCRLKDTDPYVRIIWSFGSDQQYYLYGRDREQLKKAQHWAVAYRDPKPLADLGYDVSEEVQVEDRYERWIAISHKSPQHLDHYTRTHTLELLADVPTTTLPTYTQLDYRDVEIASDSVVYCDPPYKDTGGYGPAGEFDSEAFYQWVRTRDFPVYFSEYSAPEDFHILGEWIRCSSFSRLNNSLYKKERLYVHERWKDSITRATLF